MNILKQNKLNLKSKQPLLASFLQRYTEHKGKAGAPILNDQKNLLIS